jgi:K+-transporting ATPase c subunit
MEASTSWNPEGLFKPVMGLLYLCLFTEVASPVFKNGNNGSLLPEGRENSCDNLR